MVSPESNASSGESVYLPPTITDATLFEQLSHFRIDITRWGAGSAKGFSDLLKEIQEGESVLAVSAQGELARELRVLRLDVFCRFESGDTYRLKEDRQEFKDGRVRTRPMSTSLGEKLKPDELPEEAVARALFEELGIQASHEALEFTGSSESTLDSPSYPGLPSHYVYYDYVVYIDPREFDPQGYREIQSDKTNYFTWQTVRV